MQGQDKKIEQTLLNYFILYPDLAHMCSGFHNRPFLYCISAYTLVCCIKRIYHSENGQKSPVVLHWDASPNLYLLCLQYTALHYLSVIITADRAGGERLSESSGETGHTVTILALRLLGQEVCRQISGFLRDL